MPAAPHPDDFKMGLMEHLAELRRRLLRVTIAVIVLGGASLVFARELYGLLMRPILLALPAEASTLVYTSAIEEINVLMKIGLYAGIFVSTPVLLWEIWSFVAPGLYPGERKLASPFIICGSLAFFAGALFCYFVLLPQMFTFLLQNENSATIQRRVDKAKLREDIVVRYLRLGEVERAAAQARSASGDLEAPGDGRTEEGAFGLTLIPKQRVDAEWRIHALGRIIDAVRTSVGDGSRPILVKVLEQQSDAITAFGEENYAQALSLIDAAATALAGVAPAKSGEFSAVWKLEKLIGLGQSRSDSMNWTRPMLSMSEQLTLVLVLELAFGLIFQLPLVMALLGMVGLVSSKFLFRYQRHAFILCLLAAAVITPTGDAVNLALMAGPMLLCYELGVLLVWMVERRRSKIPGSQDEAPAASDRNS
jgi:sec-independent protein translocase protein TatC